jgi:protein-S-isoprenylcysteine O-methyltransferase Ste14
MPKSEEEKIWYLKIVFKVLFALLFILASMLVLAGRLDYWQGWVFGGICVFLVLIQSVFFKDKTSLVKERIKPGPGTKWWDKIFMTSFALLYLVIIVIAPLDAGRFEWSGQLPLYVYIISYPAFFLSISIFEWAMLINRWFSSVVRIQKDRGQRVVQTGPYRIVRHPGYTGGILIGIFTSLILGSLWALIPGSIAVILLILRTYLEDITLQKELSGYADYARKVRYRLLPGIW